MPLNREIVWFPKIRLDLQLSVSLLPTRAMIPNPHKLDESRTKLVKNIQNRKIERENYILVKRRPTQKLPMQRRRVHLVVTPPSSPLLFLQFISTVHTNGYRFASSHKATAHLFFPRFTVFGQSIWEECTREMVEKEREREKGREGADTKHGERREMH